MATLNETIEQVQNVFNDIEGALQEQGVNTENLKPVDYANAVRGIVNNISVENVSFLPVMIFCYSSSIPTKPTGGNWIQNEYTNQITPPEGWYLDLNDIEDTSIGQDDIYMSVCIFKHDNTKYLDWTTPVRISGKDGKDGKTGKQGPAGNIAGVVVEYNTPLYTVTTAQTAPDKPSCTYDIQNKVLNINSEGWEFDTPDEASLGANILWQSIARYYSDSQSVDCSNPVRISAGNPDVFKENGFYTEYCITKELNGSKTEWFTPASADPPVPTLSSPFLWARDVMNTTVTGKHIGPVYLFATYDAGLLGIDVDYTCAPSKEDAENQHDELWFDTSDAALIADVTKNYQGLTEDTKYLWAREQFLYSNKEPDIHYRIISTYTAAEKAAIIYSAGVFKEKVKYVRTEEQTPYVFFADGVTLDENNKYSNSGKKYYYFILKYSYDDDLHKVTPTNNVYPSIEELYISSTASGNKCNWEKMESFDAIYSDIGVFKAANVGQFVFDDKYIFSQEGKEGNYTDFVDYAVDVETSEVKRKGIALAIEKGAFTPNILLNAITGEAKFGGGTSVLRADGSGYIADGKIKWKNNGDLLVGDDNGFMAFENGELSLSGSVNIGVNSKSISNWDAFSEIKNELNSSIEAAQARTDDLQYLKGIFEKSVDVDGVVMSEMVAVKNENDETEAFFNGGDFAGSGDSKLILAAGIPEPPENSSDSSTLEERAKEAATQLYENGTLKTNKIVAKEGSIGPFLINYYQLKSSSEESTLIDNEEFRAVTAVQMSNAVLSVERDTYDSEKKRVGYSQAVLFPGASALSASYASIIRNHVPPHAAAEEPYWWEEQPCIALIVGASGANPINKGGFGGNFAIQAENGMFAGLRPKVRMITASSSSSERTLTEYDHTIIVTASSGTETISLPEHPQEGQRYEIYTIHANMDLTIDFKGRNTYSITQETDYNGSNANFTTYHRRHIILIYAGGKWWMTYEYLVA